MIVIYLKSKGGGDIPLILPQALEEGARVQIEGETVTICTPSGDVVCDLATAKFGDTEKFVGITYHPVQGGESQFALFTNVSQYSLEDIIQKLAERPLFIPSAVGVGKENVYCGITNVEIGAPTSPQAILATIDRYPKVDISELLEMSEDDSDKT
jgi:hypothetical protein